jgi:hypothetical protein
MSKISPACGSTARLPVVKLDVAGLKRACQRKSAA